MWKLWKNIMKIDLIELKAIVSHMETLLDQDHDCKRGPESACDCDEVEMRLEIFKSLLAKNHEQETVSI